MAAALAGAAAGAATGASKPGPERPRRLLKPRRLERGDLVGLIAPGGVVDEALIQKCVANLESLGFSVKPGANLRAARGGYAGTVEQRLEDLHAMFRDREVAAIWAARGGSGCPALLPRIDYGLVRRNPKVLVGYSDITALHLALYAHAGLVSFHGPVASSTFSDYSVAQLHAVLMEPRERTVLPIAEEQLARAESQPQLAPRTFRSGRAQGRLIGGNLSTLCALVGTPYLPPTRRALLFLEEVGEAPYRIDRMLTQLRQAGLLAPAAAAMLGVFQRCEATDGEPSLTLAETLEGQLSGLGIPAAYGYSFGHVPQQYTLPVGVRASLDTEARTLTLLESAVSA